MGAEKKKFPKIRFEGFSKDWGQEKLRTIFSFSKGKGYSKSSLVDDGNPILLYGSLYTDYKSNIKNVKTYAYPLDKPIYSTGDEVILPSSGESDIDIARASAVSQKGVLLGGDLNIIRSEIDGVFLAYYLNSAKKLEIAQLAQGISVVHLYPSQLQTLNISFPKNPKEQQKIASCLSSLDALITAQTEKIEELKQHKKGLMQGLFPKSITN